MAPFDRAGRRLTGAANATVSASDDTFVKTRQMPGDARGFRVALEQIGSVSSHVHGPDSHRP